MNTRAFVIAGATLIALAGSANADDHLFEAKQHGLGTGQGAANTHAFTTNSAGHSGKLAPGQGSPFTGNDTKTPATDTDAANTHANVKDR